MSLDRFIQDFVQTNKLMNQYVPWCQFVLRSRIEDGRSLHVYSFESGGTEQIAVAQRIVLPDAEYYRVRLTHPLLNEGGGTVDESELRFDILRILQESTHTRMQVITGSSFIAIQLTARHGGRANILFVIEGSAKATHKLLV